MATGKRRAAGAPSTKAAGPRTKKAAKPKATPRSRAKKVLKWGLVGLVAMMLLAVGGFFVLYQAIDIPVPNDEYLTETTHVYYADGETDLGEFAVQTRDSVELDEVSQEMKDAVVAAENQSFWTDEGIDPKGILRAAFSNASGNVTQGASTITQQYVKILYLSQERTWTRKAKEAILSLKVENQYSKEEVLEGYLNTIYFGRGSYGVQAAAQAWFGVDAGDLDLRQSAVLASVLNDPNDLDPASGRDSKRALKGRYAYVLGAMADTGAVSAEEAERAAKRLPKLVEVQRDDAYGGQKGHVLEMVRSELLRLGFSEQEIDGGGLEVTTTFTPKAMSAAAEGVAEARPEGFGDKELHVGVASVEPGTGAVRGMFGGQDYLQSQLNWAVAGGQAGSTFKPFAVAAGLKEGFSLKDTFEGNSPYVTEGGDDFENQGDTDYGSAVSLLTATAKSINTAFIDLTLSMEGGPAKIIETATAMGIPPGEAGKPAWGFPTSSPGLEPQTGVSLGSQTVSPINMANAYATIAAGGKFAKPYIIEKVVDAGGETRYTHKVSTEQAISEDIAADTSYALQEVVRSGSGVDAQALGRPAAGKTGTATRDDGAVSSAWFTGYTPQLATSVVYVRGQGNGQLDGWLPSFFGGDFPLATWNAVMTRAMEGEPIEEFPPPAWVDGEAPAEGHEPYTPPPTTQAPPPPPPDKDNNNPPPPPESEETPETIDSDGDGVADDRDPCPNNADIPGSPDADGNCEVDEPEPEPEPDSDGDGVPDARDSCPNNPDIPGAPDANGDCIADTAGGNPGGGNPGGGNGDDRQGRRADGG